MIERALVLRLDVEKIPEAAFVFFIIRCSEDDVGRLIVIATTSLAL